MCEKSFAGAVRTEDYEVVLRSIGSGGASVKVETNVFEKMLAVEMEINVVTGEAHLEFFISFFISF